MSNPKEIDLVNLLIEQMHLKFWECVGSTIVVTGAGQGIGLQVARAFAILGGKVVIAEINEETGKRAETLIRGSGGHALFIKTDVSNSADVANLARRARHAYGHIDILVNNAIRCPVIPVLDMDEKDWDSVIAVNLRGAFLTTKAFLPEMLERDQGIMINLVSLDAMPGLSAYIASKQGISGFSQSLALETANSGVSVIPFGPGMVDTPGIRGAAERLAPELGMSQDQFLNLSLHVGYEGLMPAEHAAAALVFLAVRLAKEYHGQPVTGYEILERVGVLKTSTLPPLTVEQTQAAASIQPAMPDAVESLKINLGQVTDILHETRLEFEKLPLFVRPIARSGFKNKSGWSLEDWQRAIEQLAERLGEDERENIIAQIQSLIPRLERLCEYYRGAPGETARFTRDADLLDAITATSTQRIGVIQQLKDILIRQVG